jgi:hypothetical protein
MAGPRLLVALSKGAELMDAEQYRRKAEHYLIRARQMMSPANRFAMIDLAAIWMRLAERAKPENLQQQTQSQGKVRPLAAAAQLNRLPNGPSGSWSNIVLLAWGCAAPIHRLVKTGTFEPEQLAVLGGVFEDVLQALGLVDRHDPLTELVARKVIELAQTGERDPVRLRQLTLEAFEAKRK